MAEVTKDQFVAYERVRQEGTHNMLTDGQRAAVDAGLDWLIYQRILADYDGFDKRWPDVRTLIA